MENGRIIAQVREIREVVTALLGQEIVVTRGRGRSLQVFDGVLEAAYPNLFTVTYQVKGQPLREGFKYQELCTDGLTIVVKNSGLELIPKESA